ncbi:Protein CBG25312 [Caenorhabditis briggsae]|uniref:Protein CBG25312 n=1 Tax=Caenorhabditis briggsae TaxID=6238 RepID=B6III2_CAEBR|nr:Protein CBG25312 [Caenorhabditis briggsae]CAR99712.1 Protein CBG25312 [Caenorhabditis briggsae]
MSTDLSANSKNAKGRPEECEERKINAGFGTSISNRRIIHNAREAIRWQCIQQTEETTENGELSYDLLWKMYQFCDELFITMIGDVSQNSNPFLSL